MSAPADDSGIPLPELPPLALAARTGHPVYAALLADLTDRAASPGEPVCAQYEDAP